MSRSIKTYMGMTNKIRDNGDFRGGRIDGNWIRKLPSTVFVRSKAEEWTQWFSLYSLSAFLCNWKNYFLKKKFRSIWCIILSTFLQCEGFFSELIKYHIFIILYVQPPPSVACILPLKWIEGKMEWDSDAILKVVSQRPPLLRPRAWNTLGLVQSGILIGFNY